MKHITRIAMALAAAAGLAISASSCVQEQGTDQSSMPEFITGIIVSGEDPDLSDFPETKVSYNSSLEFSWDSDDVLAIFPVGGHQVDFPLSDFAGGKTAKFDGGAWALRSNYEYAAYYPYSHGKYYTTDMYIPVDYRGQKQVGNGSVDNLGDFAFLFAEPIKSSADGSVNLQMKQVGGLMRIRVVIPSSSVSLVSATLKDNDADLIVGGKVNLRTKHSGSQAYVPKIVNAVRAEVISIDLESIRTTSDNSEVIIWLWMAPQALTGHRLTLTLTSSDGQRFQGAITATKDIVAGSAKGFDFGEVEESGNEETIEYVIIGGKKWATMNLGATTVAGSPSTCFGDYYAFGETTPRYSNTYWAGDRMYITDWKTGRGNYSSSYYPNPSKDGNGTLYAESDAATQALGGKWHIPTWDDFESLFAACAYNNDNISKPRAGSSSTTAKGIYICDDFDGVKGILFSDGTNRLFFPCCGLVNSSSVTFEGEGYYWTSQSTGGDGFCMHYDGSTLHLWDCDPYKGLSIRPVCD